MNNVLYIPNFKYNLLCVSKLVLHSDIQVVFSNIGCFIQNQKIGRRIGSVNQHVGLYVFTIPDRFVNYIDKCNTSNLCPNRLGHIFDKRLELLKQKYYCIHLRKDHCEACHMAKQKKLPFPNSDSHALKIFDIIHVDIWGPFPVSSLHGHRYFLIVVDDHSRFTWVYIMQNKSETRKHLIRFINYVETHFNVKVKTIRSDNGREFTMTYYFNSKGIAHQTTCNETPEQNGIVERKHQHLLNVTRALLFHSKLSNQFWTYALMHATFLINHMPTPFLQNTSPYEKIYNKTYYFNQLKVSGCLCYSSTLSTNRTKIDHCVRASIFLSFPCNIKGYVVYDIKNHDVKISRNVIFYEDIFPSLDTPCDNNIEEISLPTHNAQDFDNDEFISHNDNTVFYAPSDS